MQSSGDSHPKALCRGALAPGPQNGRARRAMRIVPQAGMQKHRSRRISASSGAGRLLSEWVERDLGEFRKRQELGYVGHYSPGQT